MILYLPEFMKLQAAEFNLFFHDSILDLK